MKTYNWEGVNPDGYFLDKLEPIPSALPSFQKLFQVSATALSIFFFSSRRRHTRSLRDWSSDVCSSDLPYADMAASTLTRLLDQYAVDWANQRSEERRVGKESRSQWAADHPDDYFLDKLEPIPSALPSFQKLFQVSATAISIP